MQTLEEEDYSLDLSTIDPLGQRATAFLNELFESLEHNKVNSKATQEHVPQETANTSGLSSSKSTEDLPSGAENWPIRYKRGVLTVVAGRNEGKAFWVHLGGLLLCFYEKLEVRLI